MWSSGRHCRYIQGPDSRTVVYSRGTDDRPDHGVGYALIDSFNYVDYNCLCIYGIWLWIFLCPKWRFLCGQDTVCVDFRRVMWLGVALFHSGDEYDGKLLQPHEEPSHQVGDRMWHTLVIGILVSTALWRGLWFNYRIAQWWHIGDCKWLDILFRGVLIVVYPIVYFNDCCI